MTDSKYVICGAAPDTNNLGVSALLHSTVSGLMDRVPGAEIAVLGHGRGVRSEQLPRKSSDAPVQVCGAFRTRRIWRPESWFRIRGSARIGWPPNAIADLFKNAHAILDVSGGDSFTDLYGSWRFKAVVAPKLFALQMGRPLILLPQTYGPFNNARARHVAAGVLRRSTMAWARDERSYEVLRELLGADWDPQRHCCGVDLAFALETCPPPTPPPELEAPLRTPGVSDSDTHRPVMGLNVSGLIFNDPAGESNRFGFKAEYREVIRLLIQRFLAQSNARILLIPHVVTAPGHYESDISACAAVSREIGTGEKDRVMVADTLTDPRHVKWLISRMDWFCGTRMHSTIAALSSGVPTAAIAYSVKTEGVFATCGQQAHVADPRALGTSEMVEHLWTSWLGRREARAFLEARLPAVRKTAARQMDLIAAAGEQRLQETPALANA